MLAFLILLFGVISRLFVHLPNFTPVIALALFGGVTLEKRYALFIPLALMVVSDLIIGFHAVIFFTWSAVVLCSIIGLMVRKQKSPVRLFAASIFAAVLFFVVSNFGAWLVMYPRTTDGFVQCYIAAIPFFRYTLLSTVAYSAVFFVLYEAVARNVKDVRLAKFLSV
jgi:hypothetical protein